MVVYGIITETSVGQLLMAGFIPGAISAAMYAAVILVRFKLNPSLGAPITGIPWAERFRTLPEILPIVLVIVAVLGGMYTGWSTPTERSDEHPSELQSLMPSSYAVFC